jgi:thymidine kinase
MTLRAIASMGSPPPQSSLSQPLESAATFPAHFSVEKSNQRTRPRQRSRTTSVRTKSTMKDEGECADESHSDEWMEMGGERRGRGAVHLITGPMFSGKTSALMREVERERRNGRAVFVIKSALDAERFGDGARRTLMTHDGRTLEREATAEEAMGGAVHVRALGGFDELQGDDLLLHRDAEVVAIDEAQFMANLVPFVEHCAEMLGQVVYVAGLDGDYRRRKFGQVLDLVPLCDSVTRLKGQCATCGRPSLFSRRIVVEETSVVSVGGADKYAPACRACYAELHNSSTSPR